MPDQLVLVYPLMHAVPSAPSASLRTALPELPDAMRLTPRMIDSASENYLGTSSDVPAPGYAMPANADLDGLLNLPATLVPVDDALDRIAARLRPKGP